MWSDTEVEAFAWFKLNYDKDAILTGGYDSTKSDIYSPQFNEYIEVKQLRPSARCGQFTNTTATYDVCKKVIEGQETEENAKEFVKLHYADKKVNKFIVVSDNDMSLETIEEFLNNHNFQWQTYAKKSGTSSVSKKYYSLILNNLPTEIRNNRLYITDESLIGQYFWFEGIEFFISKTKTTYGEVRQCSKTKNKTWLVQVS